MDMYREVYSREGPTPRGSWRRGRSGQRYWSERVEPDPNKVFDFKLGRWRKKTDDEVMMEITIPVPVSRVPLVQTSHTFTPSSDWGDIVSARRPHLMSTADLLRERYSGVVAYPGRTAEILSELERRKVFDPEGLAIKWHIL